MASVIRVSTLIVALFSCIWSVAQENPRYEHFTLKGDDLYWTYMYDYRGTADSLRGEIVRMLKSKYYTYNVFKTPVGYNGELNHYQVNCRKYDRKFLNTPRIFWSGEWTGKFVIEVTENAYKVTVFALYAEEIQKNPANFRMERIIKGRYVEMVTKHNRTAFKNNEMNNLQLLDVSLKDEFDIKQIIAPTD